MENIEKSDINISVNGKVIAGAYERTKPKHTEDMHEIITKVPSWILRWGIMLFFGILLIAVAISVIVRYPDTIKAGLKIGSINNSKTVIADASGIISKIFVRKEQLVKKGQPLVVIDDAGKTIVLTAPQDGKVAFVAIVQEGYFLKRGQEVFHVTPTDEQFFGIVQVHQNQINKITEGQNVIIKLNNYPVEEYGQINGTISYIADEPAIDGLFAIKVNFNHINQLKNPIKIKSWMTGNAEIITEDVSLQSRIFNSIVKGLK